MCRKVKDVKTEDLNRLKEKYDFVIRGSLELNIHKISNFVNLVIPTLAEQFKDQSDVRYFCLFSNCFPHKRSYKTKQKYVQHLCLKHAFQLPGQGIFLLNNDHNVRYGGFGCQKCGKNFKRKDHFDSHVKNVENCSKTQRGLKKPTDKVASEDKEQNVFSLDSSRDISMIEMEKSFSTCSLIDISLDQPSIICLED
ncbi:unnamed protein product [Brachionus calyciflorus]|uniref:C2H2-type domain-containing protein n=1 Tax=Brachionus calyciflorus TaxID=104777 RepID=A0A814I9N9_9BILA|nr:unnamed protein product [Brachionus calyciflorus]